MPAEGNSQQEHAMREGEACSFPGSLLKTVNARPVHCLAFTLFIQFAIWPSELLKLSFEECFSIVLLVAAGRTDGVNNFAGDRD
ncbi:MAG: hypothetical protein JWQ71_4705 [Pedosphaera sp.]|nr:hypothetical protein [Pedosphaera sp.]